MKNLLLSLFILCSMNFSHASDPLENIDFSIMLPRFLNEKEEVENHIYITDFQINNLTVKDVVEHLNPKQINPFYRKCLSLGGGLEICTQHAHQLEKTPDGFQLLEQLDQKTLDSLFPRTADIDRKDIIHCVTMEQLIEKSGVKAYHDQGHLGQGIQIVIHDEFSSDPHQLGHGDTIDFLINKIAPNSQISYVNDTEDINIDSKSPTIINMSYHKGKWSLIEDSSFKKDLAVLKSYASQGAIIVTSAGNKNILMGSTLASQRLADAAATINNDPGIEGCLLIAGSSDYLIASPHNPSLTPQAFISDYSQKAGNASHSYVHVPFTRLLLPQSYNSTLQQLESYKQTIGTSFASPIIAAEISLMMNVLSRVDNNIKIYPTGKEILQKIRNGSLLPESIPYQQLENIGTFIGHSPAELSFLKPKHIYGLGEFDLKNAITARVEIFPDNPDAHSEENRIQHLVPTHLHDYLKKGYQHVETYELMGALLLDKKRLNYESTLVFSKMTDKLRAYYDTLPTAHKIEYKLIQHIFEKGFEGNMQEDETLKVLTKKHLNEIIKIHSTGCYPYSLSELIDHRVDHIIGSIISGFLTNSSLMTCSHDLKVVNTLIQKHISTYKIIFLTAAMDHLNVLNNIFKESDNCEEDPLFSQYEDLISFMKNKKTFLDIFQYYISFLVEEEGTYHEQ